MNPLETKLQLYHGVKHLSGDRVWRIMGLFEMSLFLHHNKEINTLFYCGSCGSVPGMGRNHLPSLTAPFMPLVPAGGQCWSSLSNGCSQGCAEPFQATKAASFPAVLHHGHIIRRWKWPQDTLTPIPGVGNGYGWGAKGESGGLSALEGPILHGAAPFSPTDVSITCNGVGETSLGSSFEADTSTRTSSP